MHSNDLNFWVHRLHIDHNAPCLPPSPKKKIGISIVANFSWVSQLSQEFKSNSNERFQGGRGGKTRCTMVAVKMVNCILSY